MQSNDKRISAAQILVIGKSRPKEKLLEISFIEERKLFEIIKRCLKPFPQSSLFAKIRFNLFDFISLVTLHFEIL